MGLFFVLILESFLQSNIALDIDYIEKWFKTEGGEIFFVISKALLKFHDVTDFIILIDWGKTNNSEFSGCAGGGINKITREKYTPLLQIIIFYGE